MSLFFLCAVVLLAMTSCARTNTAALHSQLSGTGFHGRFCGPNFPEIEDKDPDLVVQKLRSIRPVDDLDAYCQQHDICYVAYPNDRDRCDFILVQGIQAARWSTGCGSRIVAFADAFSDTRPDLDLAEGRSIGIGDKTIIGKGIGRAVSLVNQLVLLPFGGGPAPAKYEQCNSLTVDNKHAIGVLGFSRRLSSSPRIPIDVRYSATDSNVKFTNDWVCSGDNRNAGLAAPPLCVSSSTGIELRVWRQGMVDDYWKPWTLPQQKLIERTSDYLRSIEKNGLEVDTFETVSLNGVTALRLVYRYNSGGVRRMAVTVAYAVHGYLNFVSFSFPEADYQRLLPVSHALIANVKAH